MTTAVLIPGAGGMGWYWHLVERDLRSRGYDAIAVNLVAYGRVGLAAYADAIVDAVDGRTDVALIAQSMGASGPGNNRRANAPTNNPPKNRMIKRPPAPRSHPTPAPAAGGACSEAHDERQAAGKEWHRRGYGSGGRRRPGRHRPARRRRSGSGRWEPPVSSRSPASARSPCHQLRISLPSVRESTE